jgi:hypothetical protein
VVFAHAPFSFGRSRQPVVLVAWHSTGTVAPKRAFPPSGRVGGRVPEEQLRNREDRNA